MATATASPVVASGTGRGRAVGCLALMTVVAAATGVFDLVAQPRAGTDGLVSTRDYVFTFLLIPFATAMAGVLFALHGMAQGRDGRRGSVGLLTRPSPSSCT